MKIDIQINDRRLTGTLTNIRKRVDAAIKSSTQEAASVVSRYIKDNLLSGGMLRDTTNYQEDRSDNNTSLEPGELKKAIFARGFSSENRFGVTVGVKGDPDEIPGQFEKPNPAYIAKILQEGRTGPWLIEAQQVKKLYFAIHKGPREGEKMGKKEVENPGWKPFPFMHQALQDKKEYIKILIQRSVRQAAKR